MTLRSRWVLAGSNSRHNRLSTLVGLTAHHLALLWIHFLATSHVHLRGSVNPAATICGEKRGESGGELALGNIPWPDQPYGVCRSLLTLSNVWLLIVYVIGLHIYSLYAHVK